MELGNNTPFLSDGKNHYLLEPNKVFTIGRAIENSLTIPDLRISRTHCVFKEENGMWTIHDQSGNGTYVNDIKLSKTSKILSHRDQIKLSPSCCFEFHDAQSNLEEDISILDGVDAELSKLNNDNNTPVGSYNLRSGAKQNCSTTGNNKKRTLEEDKKPVVKQKKTATESTVTNILEEPEAGPSKTQQAEDMENEMMCSICAELFVKAQTLNCSHTFCRMCINQWKKKNKLCPICRRKITSVNPTLVIDNLIEKMMETSPQDLQEHRKKLLAEREQEEKQKGKQPTRRSRNQRNRRNTNSEEQQPAVDVLLISSDEESDIEFGDHYDFFETYHDDFIDDDDDDDDMDWHHDNAPFIPGAPGAYYGGYGSCFNCGARGHWSVGCPLR